VAWVAIGAVVGLAICGLWAISSKMRERTAAPRPAGPSAAGPRRTAPPAGTPRRGAQRPPRSGRSRVVVSFGLVTVAVLLLGLVVFLVAIDLRGAASDGVTETAVTTSPTVPGLVRPAAQQVRLVVLNGSGFARPAADVVGVLRGMGYTINATVTAPVQQTSAVECREGFADDAAWLVYVLGPSTANDLFPDPPPPEAVDADCIVVVGREL
jgi:hypothetical protein